MERPAVGTKAKRIALSVEYIQVVGISQFVKTCRRFQLHVLRWISRVFLVEKHIPSGFGNEANRGAAKLDSEAGSGAGTDRFILASRETFPRSFRISVFFPV